MMTQSLTITPAVVRETQDPVAERPEWVREILSYVQRAAVEGEMVTLTARPLMLTPAQVADATGLSRSTISRRISSGDLQTVKVGNRHRIAYDEYLRFWNATAGDLVSSTADDLHADLFGDE